MAFHVRERLVGDTPELTFLAHGHVEGDVGGEYDRQTSALDHTAEELGQDGL